MVSYNHRSTETPQRYPRDTRITRRDIMDNIDKNTIIKYAILGAVILYFVSPIDALPGPVDDVIVGLMGLAVTRKRLGGGGQHLE